MEYSVRRVKGPDDVLAPMAIREHERRGAPETMTRPPFMCGMFGSRGSGKTTLMIQLLRWYDAFNAFDRVVIFSPTHKKDPKFEALATCGLKAKLDLYADFDFALFDRVLKQQEESLAAYEKYLLATKAYAKFRKARSKTDTLSEDELIALYEYDFADPRASEAFTSGRPSLFMVFDDQVGNKDVYRGDCKGPVAKFTLQHRHFNCSVCFMAQVYRTGVPLGIRNNLNLVVFFANKSDRLKAEVAEEMSNFVSPERFVQMWTYATESEDHGAFVVTFDAERPEWRFRKNFDTLLLPMPDAGGEEGGNILGMGHEGQGSDEGTENGTAGGRPEEGGKRGRRRRVEGL